MANFLQASCVVVEPIKADTSSHEKVDRAVALDDLVSVKAACRVRKDAKEAVSHVGVEHALEGFAAAVEKGRQGLLKKVIATLVPLFRQDEERDFIVTVCSAVLAMVSRVQTNAANDGS